MASECKFYVIKFKQTNEVSIISSNWVKRSTMPVDPAEVKHAIVTIYWPHRLVKKRHTLRTEHALPDVKTWEKWDRVEILQQSDSYETAKQYETKAKRKDNITTEEEAEETGRTTPNKSGSNLRDPNEGDAEDSGSETGEVPLPTAKLPKFPTTAKRTSEQEGSLCITTKKKRQSASASANAEYTKTHDQSLSQSEDAEYCQTHDESLSQSEDETSECNIDKRPASACNADKSSECNPGSFLRIERLLQDIDRRLRKIESQLESQKTAASATADICGDEMFNEPLQTAEEIIELNKELEKSPTKWIEFKRFCESIGGSTVTEATFRLMRRIATNGAWERFTLHGTGDKQALGSTKVYKGIGRAVKKLGFTEDKVIKKISDMCRMAAHQKGGSKFKAKDNHSAGNLSLIDSSDAED